MTLDVHDRIVSEQVIRRAPLFSSFTDLEAGAAIEASTTVHYESGDVVFGEGESGTDLYLIVSGRIRVSHFAENGMEQPIATLDRGACLGEMAFLDGGLRSATAVAAAPSRLMRLTQESMDVVERRHPGIREKLLLQGVRLLSSRLRASNSNYWDLARRSMRNQMEVAQARSRLLSLVSHELRTPLTIIKSSAQLLYRNESGFKAGFVEKILRQSDHLQLLIDDLITLALLRTDSSITEPTEFDGAALVLDVVEEISPRAREKNVKISVLRETDRTLFVADRALLRAAVRHVVDNAVKFSRRSGRVQLEVTSGADGEVRVSVRDDGQGIPEEALGRLRQSFVQSQDPLNRDVDGLGIGLSLAHEIIDAHGGRLSIDSTPGRGCRVTLSWPQPTRDPLPNSTKRRSTQNV